MPQIAQILETYASQIFWLLLTFGLVYFGIGRGMLPKIEATVDARNKRIADDLDAAERARAAASATEDQYRARMNEARLAAQKATAEAKAAAAAASETRVKAVELELGNRMAEAEAQVRAAKAQALSNIEDVAVEAAQDIVQRVAGLTPDRDSVNAAVRTALAQA